jgi:hypothetical protein
MLFALKAGKRSGCRGLAWEEDVDVTMLAAQTEGFTGADLAQLVSAAGACAAERALGSAAGEEEEGQEEEEERMLRAVEGVCVCWNDFQQALFRGMAKATPAAREENMALFRAWGERHGK